MGLKHLESILVVLTFCDIKWHLSLKGGGVEDFLVTYQGI